MHIAEGVLPPAQCAIWYAAAAPFVIHGAVKVVKEVREHPENKLLLATAGACTFLLSSIKLPSVTGSSSHPTGTGVGAILFKPPVMAFMGVIVLVFQALLLAHGGITTLGANTFSMAIAGPWIGYWVYLLTKRLHGPNALAIFLCMAISDLATYCVTSFQLAFAFPDASSGVVGAALKFLGIFAVSQVPLSIMEGFLGILLFRFLVRVAAPQLAGLGFDIGAGRAGAAAVAKEDSHV
ncbi:cobalamin biosynthesis protein CbiM [Propionibacterium acidifaciens F0233]|uniref:Cobalt transport protein CbiM n=1 Tax=Propionibacterium acidifaciens F0233 TaxID=553198 RepID=U2RVY1_9ACTN|nr:energy-coupling factor ABC transporter permease [Propionibacterium acidifaciens]AYW77540.1 energy-coupling factor ABC transporter permease [Propionibacterium acidifaciens]ERK54802.1 cobalamin biosynthesis protein CbiM [Propionibacterium acidifaciens F0233]